MATNDTLLLELQRILRESRSRQPSRTSEHAYAQQARSLQGMTLPPSSGDCSGKEPKSEAERTVTTQRRG